MLENKLKFKAFLRLVLPRGPNKVFVPEFL